MLPLRDSMAINARVGFVEILEFVLITLLLQSIAQYNVEVVDGEPLSIFAEFIQEGLGLCSISKRLASLGFVCYVIYV